MSQSPHPGSHFICGSPPTGMGLTFFADENHAVYATLVLDKRHEGPPGHVHGGFSAALLDEAMGGAVWQSGYQVVAAHIAFDLKRPVPLGTPVTVRGWIENEAGRKIYTRGTITLPDGSLAVEGNGIFVEAPHLFANTDFAKGFEKP